MREITSKDNSLIKYISKLQSSSKLRREDKRFVSEGLRVSLEALNGGVEVEAVFLTSEAYEKNRDSLSPLLDSAKDVYLLSPKLMALLSETKTPQGILCLLKTLDNNIVFDTINNKYVFLENIQDPSNMGTILRTADALGVNGVIMTEDCCDVYSPKVCRGAMGALFRVPFMTVKSSAEFISEFNETGTSYAAVVRGGEPLGSFSFENNSLVVIGNEGNGLKDATQALCKKKITIPMKGVAESLNAAIATGILVWEMMK